MFEAKGFLRYRGGFCGCSPAFRLVSDGCTRTVQYYTDGITKV